MNSTLPHIARIELHEDGWQVVLHELGTDVQFVGHDGRGLTKTEAEELLDRLEAFLAERN